MYHHSYPIYFPTRNLQFLKIAFLLCALASLGLGFLFGRIV